MVTKEVNIRAFNAALNEFNEGMSILRNLPVLINKEVREQSIGRYLNKMTSRYQEIPTKKYDGETESCCICSDDIESGMLVPDLACGHLVHQHCMHSLVMNNGVKCPLCRELLPGMDMNDSLEDLLLYTPDSDMTLMKERFKGSLEKLNSLIGNHRASPSRNSMDQLRGMSVHYELINVSPDTHIIGMLGSMVNSILD